MGNGKAPGERRAREDFTGTSEALGGGPQIEQEDSTGVSEV